MDELELEDDDDEFDKVEGGGKEEEEKIKRQLWREGKRKIPSGLSMKD